MLSNLNGFNNTANARRVALPKTLSVPRLQCVDERHEFHLSMLQARYGWSRDEAQTELNRRLNSYFFLHLSSQ
ncbi:MAG: hypothetical protein R2873_15600 [Caldilineaceae bacterium]|nr:hypothetical protein [Caldilineaceae bacterium]